MQNCSELKTTANDGCVNLHERGGATKALSKTTITRARSSNKIKTSIPKVQRDRELLSHGLQRLGSFLNTTSKIPAKTSGTFNKSRAQSRVTVAVEPAKERNFTPRILECGSVKDSATDRCTMTDCATVEDKTVELQNSTLNKEESYRDLRWTDPRLLKKYAIVKHTPYKKCLTSPILEKSDFGSDRFSEISENEISCIIPLNRKQYMITAGLYYFYTASVVVIGGICAVALITLLTWKIVDSDILALVGLHLRPKTPEYVLMSYAKCIGGAIVQIINTGMKKLVHVLTVPTSEVFAPPEEDYTWAQNFFNN